MGPSSNDAVGSRQKFVSRFTEGIGKLARNVKGDRRKEDRRTCCKIARGYRSMQDFEANLGPIAQVFLHSEQHF
ncbi:hypothetical protein B296_00050632 [Ensete ventricosum]|uniref:Uncharacterized protein n=1 Tax=Ensete ventricosum TaxID=4639 RepID=A0A426X550_ENSVE|nr:hypothetical protein B296_00050632 [Ensete ventricosum]